MTFHFISEDTKQSSVPGAINSSPANRGVKQLRKQVALVPRPSHSQSSHLVGRTLGRAASLPRGDHGVTLKIFITTNFPPPPVPPILTLSLISLFTEIRSTPFDMAASSVPLHPVASRHGQQSATMVSFSLSDVSVQQQAKAQASASAAAAALSSPLAAEPTTCPLGHPESASQPVQSSIHADRRGSYSSQGQTSTSQSPLSTSLPTTTEAASFPFDLSQNSPEWGLRHDNLEAYPCLPEPMTQMDTGLPRAPHQFKKAASWCAAPSTSMAFTSTSMQLTASSDAASPNPIRLLSAEQLASMQEAYLDQDVPHHVVFPFLHGVDGDNPAQNVFFGAPLGGQPTPRYRGLTIVRADMPSQEALYNSFQSSMHAAARPISIYPPGGSRSYNHNTPHYPDGEVRLGHPCAKSDSSCSSDESDDSDPSSDNSSCLERSHHARQSSNSMYEHYAANASMASSNTTDVSHGSGQSFFGDKIVNESFQSDTASSFSSSPSPLQHQMGGEKMNGGAIVVDDPDQSTDSMGVDQESGDVSAAAASYGDNNSSSFPDFCGRMLARPWEAQPSHSILTSTLYPCELLHVPEPVLGEGERNRPRSSTSASELPSPSKLSSSSSYKRLSGPTSSPSSSPALGSADGDSEFSAGAGAATAPRPRPKASFVQPRQASGVSLRNFKIQAAKYATISDIVLYSPVGLHDGVVELAMHFRDAQEEVYQDRLQRGLGSLRYNVFIVTDSFDVFERKFDHLIAVDSQGHQRHSVAFLDREREEMNRLTKATEIDPNVWLGCQKDVPPVQPEDHGVTHVFDSSNPLGFNFCIEAHEMAFMPGEETLQRATQYLDTLERTTMPTASNKYGSSEGQDYFGLYEGVPRAASLASPPPSPTTSIIHLECAANSQSCNNTEALNRMADDIIDFCAWIKSYACPDLAQVQAGAARARRFLLHCGDGYTETSVMALSYLMFSRELSLPDAYLDLQHRAERSFFLYGRDLPLLKRVDEKLSFVRKMVRQAEEEAQMRARMVQKPKPKHSFPWLSTSSDEHKSTAHGRMQSASEVGAASFSEPSSWAKSLAAAASGLVSPSSSSSSNTSQSQHRKSLSFASAGPCVLGKYGRSKRSSTSSSSSAASTLDLDEQEDATAARHAWFHNPRFEGSFPSRILPFLYLGNLNHAMNADMLHELGITHVVSVGESALHPPPPGTSGSCMAQGWPGSANDSSACSSTFSDSALWQEEQAGRIQVLDLKNVSDDGIDSLRATMRQSVEYIEDARRSGGKVLVHCRVGVSRSATIVLAYAMAHLDLSLVEAYLLVRSRRLNILIQPHLLFFWELRGWEKYLADEKARYAGEATPACVPVQPSPEMCPEIEYKDIDEEMTDADVAPISEADDRAFSMAALSLCSFTPGCSSAPVFANVNSGATHPSSSYQGSPQCSSPAQGAFMPTPTNTAVAASEQEEALDVDLAAGAGTAYGLNIIAPETLPFGSGSPAGIPYKSLRLTWGFLCREIAALNERYCV